MSKLSKDTLMTIYPGVLDRDKLFNSLGQSVAESIGEAFLNVKNTNIYGRIKELPEGVLDILAQDFNISWYDYDYPLATKRRVVAAAFSVHRHIGTTGAMITALSAVWPNSYIEEWFEYGGDPFYFRAVVNIEDEETPIDIETIRKVVDLYKNERSWLEYDSITIRTTVGIVIETDSQSHIYHTPVAGTIPRWKNHGSMEHDGLRLGTNSQSSVYSVRRCGMPAGL